MHNYIIISKQRDNFKARLKTLLSAINISKQNVFEFIPQENGLTADQIRRIISISAHNFALKTAFIVWGFDSAKEELQNMLLKTLEEHQTNLYFFLLAGSLANILPTIISRCQVINAHSLPAKPSPSEKQTLDKLINKAQKSSFFLSEELKNDFGLKKDKLTGFLSNFITYGYYELVENAFINKLCLAKKLKLALKLHRLIEKNHLDPELSIDQLFIN